MGKGLEPYAVASKCGALTHLALYVSLPFGLMPLKSSWLLSYAITTIRLSQTRAGHNLRPNI